jgi:hypothetical protein
MALIKEGFPKNTAVISFYSGKEACKVDFQNVAEHVFYVPAPDFDIEVLEKFGYTYDSYMANAPELAKFIILANARGLDIICQCDYGQSRSAACAAAILEFFEGRGIDVFADYRYYPNRLIFNKLRAALGKEEKRRQK